MVAFAREFDPQPFHVDREAAKSTMMGELTASGWHSCCLMMRLMFDGFLSNSSSLGSGGLDEVKWLAPVRPGDVITGRYTVLQSRASDSRPNLGICKSLCEVFNQHGDLVMTCRFHPIHWTTNGCRAAMTGFLEDIEVGPVIALGSHVFTANEIIGFARRYDPQPFHLSEEAAKESLFGRLCASGWHTACVWMRLVTDYHNEVRAELRSRGEPAPNFGPSPGIRDLVWPAPVFVDDEVSYSTQIRSKRELNSRPGWGMIESRNEGVNQRGELVMSFTGNLFVERRSSL